LQHAQEFDLQGRRQLANLIEKHSAAIGYFEPPFLLTERSGECSLLVPEQLAFQQRLCQRGAINCHERLIGAFAVLMQGAGGQFFPGAALAGDEHRRIGGRGFGNKLINLLHRRAFANHVVFNIDVRAQTLILALQPLHVARVFQRHRGNTRDGRHQLQMIVIKDGGRLAGGKIDDSQGPTQHLERHA
jgi:hypothetical protein